MSIIVPLDGLASWKQILDSALELAGILSTGLVAVTGMSGPAQRRQVQEHLEARVRDDAHPPQPPVRYLDAIPADGDLPAFNQNASVLVLATSSTEHRTHQSLAPGSGRWRGPILILPGETGAAPGGYARRMIVIVPEEDGFDRLEPWAARIARRAGSHIALLTALPPDTASGLDRRFTAAQDRLHQRAEQLRRCGLRTTWEVRIGDAGEEIYRMAETTGASLIVLARPDRNTPGEALLDAMIEKGHLSILLTP